MRFFGEGESEAVRGQLGHFGLGAWWIETFTAAERAHIEARYRPMGRASGSRPLTRGDILHTSVTAGRLLSTLASWFSKPWERSIAERLFAKAETIPGTTVLDAHFHCHQKIVTLYPRWRSDESLVPSLAATCERQIAIAPAAAKALQRELANVDDRRPFSLAHTGFSTLVAVLEGQSRYAEAIAAAAEAKRQGWKGDWDRIIERCEHPKPKRKKRANNPAD